MQKSLRTFIEGTEFYSIITGRVSRAELIEFVERQGAVSISGVTDFKSFNHLSTLIKDTELWKIIDRCALAAGCDNALDYLSRLPDAESITSTRTFERFLYDACVEAVANAVKG